MFRSRYDDDAPWFEDDSALEVEEKKEEEGNRCVKCGDRLYDDRSVCELCRAGC